MLKNCILLIFLVFILGSSNIGSAKSNDCNTDPSGIVTKINTDLNSDYADNFELLDNEEDLSRHNNKFYRKTNVSGQLSIATGFTRIQTQFIQTNIFLSHPLPLLNNLPPPATKQNPVFKFN